MGNFLSSVFLTFWFSGGKHLGLLVFRQLVIGQTDFSTVYCPGFQACQVTGFLASGSFGFETVSFQATGFSKNLKFLVTMVSYGIRG